jgi:UDP-glucose 4-epimerase
MVLCLKTWKSRSLPGFINFRMKNLIIVTGGAGFIGSNLIELLLEKTTYQIISLDNYLSGTKKNHILNSRVNYLRGDTLDFFKYFKKKKKKIKVIFHFGEFSRIAQSFDSIENCFKSNISGTQEVIKFCLENKIKIIYSATSASLGNSQEDQHLSPYAYSKSVNMNLITNLNKWFNFKYEIIFFYNVYGPRQILGSNNMAAVIGIFCQQYIDKKPLTIVLPGTQSRKFTHVKDTVELCYSAWQKNKNRYYSISSPKSYPIKSVAKLFSKNFKYIKERKGERFRSTTINSIRGTKLINLYGKRDLKDFIENFIKNN